MRFSLFGSIRRTLAMLVLLAVLPALIIILNLGLQARRHAQADARTATLLVARSLGEIQERTTHGIHQLLLALSQAPQVSQVDPSATSEFLNRVLATDPLLANLAVADVNGNVIASAKPFARVNVADRAAFQSALRDDTFSSGDYVVSRTTGLPIFPFAQPIHDIQGSITAVILASVRLDAYGALFEKANLPPGSVLTIADRTGQRISRHPRMEATDELTPLPKVLWAAASGLKPEGITAQEGGDGIRRIYAFVQLRLRPDATPYLYLIVGVPEKQTMAAANSMLVWVLLFILYAAGLALVTAWYLGGRLLGKSMDRLVAVTERISSGDLSARVGPTFAIGEMSRLERAIDVMAEDLQQDAAGRRKAEADLRMAYAEMEQRVERRTQGLKEANERLQAEIKERGLAEAALRQSESNHRALYEQAPVGILVAGRQGHILDANPAALDLLGYGMEELEGRLYREIIHPDNYAAHPFDREKMFTGEIIAAERLLVTKDGTVLPVDVTGRYVNDKHFLIIFSDASQRKKLEQLRDDVERIVRHDLKAPLVGIVNIPNLLLKGDNLTQRQRELLHAMHATGYRMLHMLHMSLAIYKMEMKTYKCRLDDVDLLKIVRRIIKDIGHIAASSRIDVSLSLNGAPAGPADEYVVRGEEMLCLSMLENLIKNAIEASSPGDTVEIRLDPAARFLAIRNRGEVPPEIRSTFFEKYATAGKRFGTGLGTYSAKLIAATHGWDIRMDASVPGETTVVVGFSDKPAVDAMGDAGRN